MSDRTNSPLHGLYAEWEREETARRGQSERLKALFRAAKDKELNPKALRVAFKEIYRVAHQTDDQATKANELDEEVESYIAALARVRTREGDNTGSLAKAAHAASRDDEAGEHQRLSESGIADAVEPGRRTHVSAERDRAPNSETRGSSSTNDEPSPTAGPQAEAVHSQGTGAGTLAGREERSEADEVVAPAAASSVNPNRPHCQKPHACASTTWRAHCYSCQKAAAEADGFSA